MAAQTKNIQREIKSRGRSIPLLVAASTHIFAGSLVAVVGGYAVPAADTAGHKVMGVAEHEADNSDGANGDIEIRVATGVFLFELSAIVAADIGKKALVVDDQTVSDDAAALTNDIEAGLIEQLENGKVWIYVSPRG